MNAFGQLMKRLSPLYPFAATVALSVAFRTHLQRSSVVFFVLAVMTTAWLDGRWGAVLVAIASVFAINSIFLEPAYTPTFPATPADAILLLFFLVVSLSMSHLVHVLRTSRDRLAWALEMASDGIWDWNIATGYVYFSPQWLSSLGFEASDIRPHVTSWEQLLHPADVAKTMSALKAHFDRQLPMYEVENRLRTKSGEYRWNLDRGRVVEWDNKGRPMRMVGVDIDISDRKRADDEATKRIAAEAADAAKDTFISLVTHELRNPLSTISMAVSRLKAAPSSEDNRRVRMGMIERATEQQLMLVNDLLDWSRLQSNKFELHLEAANLSDVVTSAWHPVEAAAALRDIHKELHIEAGTERLFIDPKRMTQALWNLFANAVKFTPTGGKIIVRTSLNATLSISVTDSGRGVSAEDLPYLFERGWQAQTTDATRKGGLGLGLALVREIVEAHGGTIRAESAGADKGTTFTIQLPASTVQQLPLAAN